MPASQGDALQDIWLLKVHDIQEAFLYKGYTSISVKYLGDNAVLLFGEEDDTLNDILEREDKWFATTLD